MKSFTTDRFTPGEETPGIYVKDNLGGWGVGGGEGNRTRTDVVDKCFVPAGSRTST